MDKVYQYLINESGIRYRDTIVLGISGGPDSMALLTIMLKLKEELDLVLVVAHVNHNVRLESKIEEEYVKEYANKVGVIFEGLSVKSWGDDNFENEARTVRYNFFDKVVNEYNAKYLMTAHHGDDLIETILMRIVRGSTLKGYSGFSKVINRDDYKIIRPFISVTKEDLINYCNVNNVKFYIDKTNMEDDHTRNRYRKYVLPFLKEEDHLVNEKFLKFSETLLMYNDYVDKEVKVVFNKVFKDGVLDINRFKELDYLLGNKIIYSILEKIYGDDLFIVTSTHVNLIYNLINGGKSNSVVHLPNNVKVIRSYDEVSFDFDDEEVDVYEIEINELVNLPNGKNIVRVSDSDDNSNNVIRLSSSDIVLPLFVRTRRNGDKMIVKGMNGHKKVNDIFIDNKISTKDRQVWPVVCDAENNIVWVPGLKKSKFDVENGKKCDIILKYY